MYIWLHVTIHRIINTFTKSRYYFIIVPNQISIGAFIRLLKSDLFFHYPKLTVGKDWNLVRCGKRNLFGFVGDIPYQGRQHTFISITRNKACIIGTNDLSLKPV